MAVGYFYFGCLYIKKKSNMAVGLFYFGYLYN